ncbi:MAG: DUF2065 domain-containing protein [Magnetococcales bacterium]|nr:DUF2065 domain-containing protein [Magnetococcales bacterium]
MKDFLTALGLTMIIEGIPYFLAPDRMRHWILGVVKLPDASLRKTGLVLMFLGLAAIYMVRG